MGHDRSFGRNLLFRIINLPTRPGGWLLMPTVQEQLYIQSIFYLFVVREKRSVGNNKAWATLKYKYPDEQVDFCVARTQLRFSERQDDCMTSASLHKIFIL